MESIRLYAKEIQKDGETVFAVSYEPRAGKESFDYWDISEPYQSTVSVNTEELYRLLDTVFQMNWEKTEGISLEDAGIAGSKTSIFIAYNREQNAGEKAEKSQPLHGQSLSEKKTDKAIITLL